jgi:hypothetical protein
MTPLPSINLQGINTSSTHAEKIDWARAFRPHFDGWVLHPINRLVSDSSPDALVGFIFMSCAIDYLAGFWWGNKFQKDESGKAYKGFIDEYFPKSRYDAKGLYGSLRNGLVHMFTIKGKKYALTHKHPELHLKIDHAGYIILNAANFRDDLVFAKERYFDDVETKVDLLNKLRTDKTSARTFELIRTATTSRTLRQ